MRKQWCIWSAAMAAGMGWMMSAGALEVATSATTATSATSATTATTASTTTTTTTTTITETATATVVRKPVKWSPFRVCVLDFVSLDQAGQKQFLDENNQPIVIPPQNTLNDADHKTINRVMQGFVRMIDASDNAETNSANRTAQVEDNDFRRAKALDLYRTVLQGEARPSVLGAEYLNAYLGRHNDVFTGIDASVMAQAMEKQQAMADFPQDFLLRLARETGATHLIYGTVSDLRRKTKAFKGYGIETKTTEYQLDVIIKMVDLAAQRIVYSNVYTGAYREQQASGVSQLDKDIFQNLMTSALEQAAEDLYTQCRPGDNNKISVTPVAYSLTIVPAGGLFFSTADAEIMIDGTQVGNGEGTYTVPEGMHQVTIQAPGYQPKNMDINVTGDETIQVKLEK